MALPARSQKALGLYLEHAQVEAPHPLDAQRWRAFIVAVRLDGGQVDYAAVRSQLVRSGFGSTVVEHLVDCLEDGLELLDLWAIHSALDGGRPMRPHAVTSCRK
jgi:hypothetical protein